jgi:hypothetical protein
MGPRLRGDDTIPFSRFVANGLLPADWGGDMREQLGELGE